MRVLWLFVVLLLLVGCDPGTDLTAVGGNPPILSPSDYGSYFSGQNYSSQYERHVNSYRQSGAVTYLSSVSGRSYLVVPWYTTSDQCTTYHGDPSSSFTPSSSAFVVVTDELSESMLVESMSRNSTTVEGRAIGTLNTLDAIRQRATAKFPNSNLSEWYNKWTVGSGYSYMVGNHDDASDANARIIIALLNFYNNPSVTNQTLRAALLARALDTCDDFLRQNFFSGSWTSSVNASETFTYIPATGSDVRYSSMTSWGATYTGYYGDILLALDACHVATNTTAYMTAAQSSVASYFSAANYTGSSGLRFPPGRAFHWSSTTGTPTASCDAVCSPDYVDSPDGMRVTTLCTANYFWKERNVTLHPWLDGYCSKWWNTSAGVTTTAYAAEWYSNRASTSTPKSSLDGGYSGNGLGLELDIGAAPTNFKTRYDYLMSNSWNTGTDRYNGISCQGVYYQSHATTALGYAIGWANGALAGQVLNTTPTPTPPSPTNTTGQITMVLNSPSNGSSLTSSTVVFNVTVVNNNVTNSSSVNGTSLFEWRVNDTDTFSVDAEGWSGGGSVVSGMYNKTGTWGTIYKNFSITTSTVFNMSFRFWYADATNDPKIHVSSTSGGNYLLIDGSKASQQWKHVVDGGGYYTGNCGAEVWTDGDRISFVVNRSNNTWSTYHNTKFCGSYVSSSITDGGGLFSIAQAESAIAIDDVNYSVYADYGNLTYSTVNSTMNVTFYWSNGTAFFNNASVENGTYVTTTVGSLTNGNYLWYVYASSFNANTTFGNLSFSLSGVSAPVISGAGVHEIGSTFAVLNWSTNVVSTSVMNFGLTTALGSSATSPGTGLYHEVNTLTNGNYTLLPNTVYYYNITSCAAGYCSTSGPYQFTTLAAATSISNITVTNITNSSAIVNWLSVEAGDTWLYWGLTSGVSNLNYSANLTTVHQVNLSDLNASTIYYYQVKTCTQGLCNSSAVSTFVTTGNVTTISLCGYIGSLQFKPNISRGTFNASKNTYTESDVYPVNQSYCGYTYYLVNNRGSNVNYTFESNISSTSVFLFVNGSIVNKTRNFSFILPTGNVRYINVTANYTNANVSSLRNLSFTFTATGV